MRLVDPQLLHLDRSAPLPRPQSAITSPESTRAKQASAARPEIGGRQVVQVQAESTASRSSGPAGR